MKTRPLERLPIMAAVILAVLTVAACAIRLRGDESQPVPGHAGRASDPPATKLAGCRSITFDQQEALSECRKAWAEKRRQFLGQKAPAPLDKGPSSDGASSFVTPKDESRLPSGAYPIPQSEKE